MKKNKYEENSEQQKVYKKGNILKILNQKQKYEKRKYQENPQPKREYEKNI